MQRFFGINIILALITLGTIVMNPFRLLEPFMQILFLPTPIIVIISYMLYKRNERRIWYVPLSQIVMCAAFCIFLLIRDLLGFRRGGGFIDLGVGFDIMVWVILTALWVIPSAISAFVYAMIMKRREV